MLSAAAATRSGSQMLHHQLKQVLTRQAHDLPANLANMAPTIFNPDDVTQGETMLTGDTVLVTGGNGFLGQHVIKLLHEHAPHVREIRVLDLSPFTPKLDYKSKKVVTSFTGSVTESDVMQHVTQNVTSVIHIAGLVSYGSFPDFQGMERVNVDGTLNVVRACLRNNVSRLLYCSTVDVVVGFEPIRDGGEDTPIPQRFLFPGYPETKLKGEQLVLAANRQFGDDGETMLHTLSLRANVMYGELDPYYITSGLQNAKSMGGKLLQVGNGKALFQPCYVGNTAAAFIQADAALRENSKLGGQAFFIPDATPPRNTFTFMKPYLEARGYSLSSTHVPFCLMYGMLYLMELVLKAISPLVKIKTKTASCSVKYINMDIYFKAEKAQSWFNYTPLFSPMEAQNQSLPYYKTAKL